MNIAQLCTEQEVRQLVHAFYDRVRNDPLIGPVFTEHVSDWPSHLEKMVDFWSSTLRGTARFRGSPMVTHNRLTGISETHFQRWLELFRQTTQDLDNPALQARANDLSMRIAQSLWYGYQMNRQADVLPSPLLHHSQGA
jgi:hemoglobin